MAATHSSVDSILTSVKAAAEKSSVFGHIELQGRVLNCAALNSAEPAWYRVEHERDALFVSLVTANRWLSESIEADLMHHGDPMEELVHEELVELGYEGKPLTIKHYRSEDMMYTFRSPVPADGASAADMAAKCLLAYEAAFRELGDMNAGAERD